MSGLRDAAERFVPRIAERTERALRRVPAVQRRLERRYEQMLAQLRPALRPYARRMPTYATIPDRGVPRGEVLDEFRRMTGQEASRWEDGYASGAVYHGGPDHVAFLNEAYALNSQANPLHADLWPSATKFEAEVVSMTAGALGAAAAHRPGPD